MKERIASREAVALVVAQAKEVGKKVGFTSGVFDLIHPGHVKYLESARDLCDFLVVAINSDLSVRQIKGELRPVCNEGARAAVIAGLRSVEAVFLFDEANNQTNIETIKPNLYFKAGDYSKDKLTSAATIEGIGGEVVIVPFEDGMSTTKIIEKIVSRFGEACGSKIEIPPLSEAPALFLDRDGTIIKHIEYISDPSQVELFSDTIEVLKGFKDLGYRLVVVTNQPGIGLGYFSKEDFYRVNIRMMELLSRGGVLLDKIYFCPHAKSEECSCRKPGTALLGRAMKELNLKKEYSFMIGDMESDVQAGRSFGLETILLREKGPIDGSAAEYVTPSLTEARKWILERIKKERKG